MVASVAEGRAVPPDLSNVQALMELLDHPERSAPVIHVTGTNGKTSTARVIGSLLAAKGLRVGTFTSPHLELINERISADGRPISDADLLEVLSSLASYCTMLDSRPRWFELITAAAFMWFADRPVDVVVLEVGMGGRWDATNVADASVAVITNVGLDHIEFLGPTREDIAREKVGIVKPESILILGESDPELRAVFEEPPSAGVWLDGRDFGISRNELAVGGRSLDLRTPGADYEGVWLDLHGSHQGRNFACALAAVEAFFGAAVDDKLVREAAATVSSPGRMEIVWKEPLVVLDGAKNLEGAEAASQAVAEEFGSTRSVVLVVGMLGGAAKDPTAMLSALGVGTPAVRLVVTCPAPSPRSVPEALIADAARRLGCGAIETPGVAEALEAALADSGENDLILVTGSLYVVGAARSALAALS
ncbi:MAG TPA: folylpolyglutamate synthase/dihydrofolate synthase family protein [Acidimicrobiales bacterium]|jgi:dihydrofolate synthase/folylpolyglutamate synthase|nr:folylpolyglutamate synthase/dihydrofolate synthase family protein [Acidimicrobiales bacterium]